MELLRQAEGLYDYMLARQGQLHDRPETAGQERFATELISRDCREAGLEVMDLGPNSGVVARLGAGGSRPVALRADIDAVAGEGGPRHICGHDYHSAALLGAMRLLASRPQELAGDICFIFQPAEETLTGAARLLERGLGQVIAPGTPIFGLHNRPELPWGAVGVTSGPLMAAKKDFRVLFRGRSGHGSAPHLCRDPLVAAAAFVQGVQTIVSRNIDPVQPCVCAVCSMHSGSEDNMAPETARLSGSIRALAQPIAELAARRVQELARDIAQAYGCQGECSFTLDLPALVNPEDMAELARQAARSAGASHIAAPGPILACEDFSRYQALGPSFFYWVGSGIPGQPPTPWHSPDFAIDPRFLIMACGIYAASVYQAQR